MDQETLLKARSLRNNIVGMHYTNMRKYKNYNGVDAKMTEQRCTEGKNDVNKNMQFKAEQSQM